MKTGKLKAVAAAALTAMGLMATSGAEAALVERLGGKAIYDDVANLTWARDAHLIATTGAANPEYPWMTYSEAVSWVGTLEIEGVSGWRLPGGPMAAGLNQTDSELCNLFYNVLGGAAGHPIGPAWWDPMPAVHNANVDMFVNLIPALYWAGVSVDDNLAWGFGFSVSGPNRSVPSGTQYISEKSNRNGVWAVHDGDVGASPVPVPGALALMGPALLGLLGVKRSRRRAGPALG
jgi:hypothetical protein